MKVNDLIYMESLETGVNYVINLREVIYYEVGVYKRKDDDVGVYKRKDDDGAGRDSYYVEFFFENHRRLKFIRDFGTQADFYELLRNGSNISQIQVTKEI